MNVVKQTQIFVIRAVLVLDILIILVSALFLKEAKPFIMGLIFGSAISTLNFMELANTLNRAVKMTANKAQTFTVAKYFVRYIVTAIVVYVSIVAPYINVLGTILGLVMIKLIIFVWNLLGDKRYYKNIFKRKEDESSEQ